MPRLTPCPLRVSCFTLLVVGVVRVWGHAQRRAAEGEVSQVIAAKARADIESKLVVAAGRERQATPRCRRGHVAVPNVNVPEQMRARSEETESQAIKRKPRERTTPVDFRPIPRRCSHLGYLHVPIKLGVYGDHLETICILRSDTAFGHGQESSFLAAARAQEAETIR